MPDLSAARLAKRRAVVVVAAARGPTYDACTPWRRPQASTNARSDDDVVTWLLARSDEGIFDSINDRLRERGIRDDEHFAQVLPRYPVLRDYPHLRNWFEILDLDDRWSFDPANTEKVAAAAAS